ncbi:MAG: pyridoxal phosphate-dependent aminotransferase [Deltaproteobacteria bacterium]|nr:pyridoxal phosphate-dependent aminotransferase [Deltaproteobacteria bacterium]
MNFKDFYYFRSAVFKKIPNGCDLSFINPRFEFSEKILNSFLDAVKARNRAGALSYGPAKGDFHTRLLCINFWNHITGSNYSEESAIVTQGTKDALNFFLRVFTVPGQKIFLERPTYPVYEFLAKANGLIIEKSIKDAELIVLSAPNNPSGQVNTELLNELKRYAAQKMIFFDGVYIPLIRESVVFLKELRTLNSILFESFSISKAFGGGGIRCGVLFYPTIFKSVIETARTRIGYNPSVLSEAFLGVLLTEGFDIPQELIYLNRHKLNLIRGFSLGQYCLSIEGLPFCWLKHPRVNKDLWEKLAFSGFLTTWGGFYGKEYSDCLRLSLTVSEVNLARFCQLLSQELNFQAERVANV